MPKLLKSGEVQLHMPKTGGSSLAAEIGVRELHGTLHDGAGQIPAKWKGLPTVATIRDPVGWRCSMLGYLLKIGKAEAALKFVTKQPKSLEISGADLDPTFGLWADPAGRLAEFAKAGGYKSWYELYLNYFVMPADRIIRIKDLKLHKNKT